MKKIIFLILIFMLFVFLGLREYNNNTYYEIKNEVLKKAINDYILQEIELKEVEKSFVAVILSKYDRSSDTAYVFKIRKFKEDELLSDSNYPMFLCRPIKSTKIVFISGLSKLFEINTPDIENYLEDKNSATYKFYKNLIMDAYKDKIKDDAIILPYIWVHNSEIYLQVYLNAQGELIDAVYVK